MKFTEHQAKESGKAVAAFLLGKPIEARKEEFHPWTPCLNIMCVDQYYLRVKPEPAPPERWSRMEHVPLNAWLKYKNDEDGLIQSIDTIRPDGLRTFSGIIPWDKLHRWLYTTGERDASGSFIFRECLVVP